MFTLDFVNTKTSDTFQNYFAFFTKLVCTRHFSNSGSVATCQSLKVLLFYSQETGKSFQYVCNSRDKKDYPRIKSCLLSLLSKALASIEGWNQKEITRKFTLLLYFKKQERLSPNQIFFVLLSLKSPCFDWKLKSKNKT